MNWLEELKDCAVHLVGITSLEIADVACFLDAAGIRSMVGHDLCERDALWEHFRAAHIGMERAARLAHFERLQGLGLELRTSENYLRDIAAADVVIVSQAWRLYERNAPLYALTERERPRFLTPMEIYLDLARQRGLRTIGVTGSNGKSTTINMVASILETAGLPHVVAGNYRYRGPILEDLTGLPAHGLVALEISNHHLLALKRTVDVAVVTNVTPNHLDEHGGLAEYIAVKRKLVEGQPPGATAVLNADDPISRRFADAARGRVALFGLRADGVDAGVVGGRLALFEDGDAETIGTVSGLTPPGDHNVENALAAALATRAAGVDGAAISAGLAGFEGPPGRLQHIRTVGDVAVIYDVESTTPESTARGLDAYEPGRVHLIAGGDNKGLSFEGLISRIVARGARLYLLDGTATDAMERAAAKVGLEARRHESLEEALAQAYGRARAGDVILVSPACKGFYNRHVRNKPSIVRLAKRLRAADRGELVDGADG